MKLQKLCGNVFSLFAVRMCQAPPLWWCKLTNNTLRKQQCGAYFFALSFECHSSSGVASPKIWGAKKFGGANV